MFLNKKTVRRIAVFISVIALTSSVVGFSSAQEGFTFKKTEAVTGVPVENAVIGVYKEHRKQFTAKTDKEGKLNRDTLRFFDMKSGEVINSRGMLVLPDGDYEIIEESSPSGYLVNPNPLKFSVINGICTDIGLLNEKFPEGKGQILIKSVDKKSLIPVSGSTIDMLIKKDGKFRRVATFTTDENGIPVNSFEKTDDSTAAGIDVLNGTVVALPGEYRFVEKNVSSGYENSPDKLQVKLKAGETHLVQYNQVKKTVPYKKTDRTSANSDSTVKSAVSGVSIKVTGGKSSSYRKLTLAVYSEDRNGQTVFMSKIGSDGYPDSSNVTKGKSRLSGRVIELPPGKYSCTVKDYKNAPKERFTVTKNRVTYETLDIGSGKSGSKLAKTGTSSFENFAAVGVISIAAGFILMRKKQH